MHPPFARFSFTKTDRMNGLLWIWCLVHFMPAHAQNPVQHTVLIHEFLPDPTPSRGLPNAEFIELKNVSGSDVQLRNWRVSNGSTSGKITVNYTLKPDSIVTLVPSGALAAYQAYGSCLVLSPFPALNNEADTLLLFNNQDSLIHAIAYNSSWYRNPVKKEGGWSLEMIDASQPCLQSTNWIASTSPNGGSPGKPNHAAGSTKDTIGPWISLAYMADSIHMLLVMNEPMRMDHVEIASPVTISSQQWLPPLFQVLMVRLQQALPKDSLITVWLKGSADCSGNKTSLLSATIGRFAIQVNTQCIINEVLFDPPNGGSDFIELYNRSAEPIDVAQLMIANRLANGSLASIKPITTTPYPLLPNHYLVITEDSSWIHKYFSPGKVSILETALPSLPDDEGTIVILNRQGTVVDELHYSADWHYSLVTNTQGISLERINPTGITQQRENWHSAASTSRFGTPGYRNAQSVPFTQSGKQILTASSLVISPDQDGFQDILRLKYVLDQPGYLANINVYSSWGTLVHTIANNQLCGTMGEFVWNGLSTQQLPLKRGLYIIQARFHLTNGKVKQEKIAIGLW